MRCLNKLSFFLTLRLISTVHAVTLASLIPIIWVQTLREDHFCTFCSYIKNTMYTKHVIIISFI